MVSDNDQQSSSSYRRIGYTNHGDGVVEIELDRPEKRNAQDAQMLKEIEDAFQSAESNRDVDCIIMSGAGSDFSSGHDLSTETSNSLQAEFRYRHDESIEEQLRAEEEYYLNHVLGLRDTRTPTIASVHGNCVLGGIMLADACDLIVASEDAKFVNPSLRHGGTGGEAIALPWSIGVRKTKELLWTGDPLYAKQAKDLGLVNRVVPLEELEDETMYLARRVAQNPTASLELTKRSMNYVLDQMGQRDSFSYHFALHQIGHHTEDTRQWSTAAAKQRDEGGFSSWLEFRDGPFKELAEEYEKDDPHVE